jgi:hypothetical protein
LGSMIQDEAHPEVLAKHSRLLRDVNQSATLLLRFHHHHQLSLREWVD